MSQGTFPLSCSQSGQLFSDDLNSLLKGINSTNSGTTAPSSGLEEGVLWLDTSEAATPVLKIYDASVPGFIVLGVNGDSFKTVVIYKNSLVTPTPVPSSTNTVLNGTLDGFTAGGNTQSWSLTQTTPGTGADTYTSIGTFEQANSIGEYTTVGDWSTPAQLSGNDGSTGARSPIIGFYVPMVTRVIGTPTTFTSVLANFNPDGLLGTNTDNQAYLDASFSQFFFGNLTSDAVEGDYGVFYNNSVETENLVASYDAASGNWITGTKKISGNLLVDGSITADAISATAITGKIVKGGKNALDDITPSGFFFNSDGEFIIGGGSENIVFNGTNLTVPALTITGELVASQIAAGTITANEIATGTITATQLSADSITADKIASLELSVEKKLSVGNIKVGAEDELGEPTVIGASSIEILDTGDFPTSGTVLIGGTESFTYTSKNADGVTFNSTTDTVEAVFAAGTVVQEVIDGYEITFGTGVVLDGSGKFAVGSTSNSLVFDGTNLVLSGVPIDASDLENLAALDGRISSSLQTYADLTSYAAGDVVIDTNKKIFRVKTGQSVADTNTTDPVEGTIWEEISASVADTTYTAGDGLGLSGTVFSTDIKANSGLKITSNKLDLNLSASGITGTLDETDGGTGLTSYATGDIMYASGSNTLAKLTKGTNGQVLKMGGSNIPAWGTDNNTTYTAGDGLGLSGTVFSTDIKANSGLKITSNKLDLNLSASGITGTLDETDGGTGLTSYATGDIMYASGSNTLAKLTKGTNGQVLKMGGSNIPAWGTDNNTTYTAGDGLGLSGTVFSTDIKANSGLKITSNKLDLNLSASGITGTLDETDGGTGLTSYATGDIMYASGSNTLAKLTKGTNGQVLKMGGSNIPAWGTDNNTTYTAGDGLGLSGTVFSTDIKANSGLKITSNKLDLNLSASGITGTLDETDGGTGLTSYATGDIMYASGSNTLAKLTKGTNGQVLKMGGSNIPAWGTDNNTTYTAGDGLGLSGTVFSTDIKANSGLKITSNKLDLNLSASGITGTLDETDGGTGLTSYATGDIMYASGSNTLAKLTKGTNGQVLKMGGSNIPAWGTDNDNNTTYTNGDGISISSDTIPKFSVNLDGSTLTNGSNGLKLTTHTGEVTGDTDLTITNGAVTNAKLGVGAISLDKMVIAEFPTVVWKTSYTTRDSSPDANGDWQPFENTGLTDAADNNEAWSNINGIKLFDTDAAGRNISALITALDPGSYIRINQAGTATGATSIASGNTYTILTVGSTDFTAIGSSDNNVGTTFTASGVGTGSGTTTLNRFGVFKISAKPTGAGVAGSRSIFFASRFQSSDTYSTTAATSLDFQVKTDAIIDGNLIVTGTIDTTAIRADSGVFNSLSADEGNFGSLVADTASIGSLSADFLDAGLILADKIIAGSIIADKIAAGAITADKITVDGNINILPPTDENDRSVQGWADSTAAAPIVRDWSPKGIDGTDTGQSAVPVANALDDILGLTANKSTDSSGTNVTIAADIGSSGFFLGQTDEGPRFFIGNADGANSNFMKWNGTQLIVAGDSLVQLNASKSYYRRFNPIISTTGGENGYRLNGTWALKTAADSTATEDDKEIKNSTKRANRFVDSTEMQIILQRSDMNEVSSGSDIVGSEIYDNIGVGSTVRVTRVLDRTAEVVDLRVLEKERVNDAGENDGSLAFQFYDWFRVQVTVVSGTPADFRGDYSSNSPDDSAVDDHDIVEFAWRYFEEDNQGIELGSLIGSNSYGEHIVFGENAVADNEGSNVVIGRSAKGLGESSIAIGDNADAGFQVVGSGSTNPDTGEHAVAIGNRARALGNESIYIGAGASSRFASNRGICIGSNADNNVLTVSDAIAIGTFSIAEGDSSVAIGDNSNASAEDGITIGRNSDATAVSAIAIGSEADATGVGSIAIGSNVGVSDNQPKSIGAFSIAIGRDAESSGGDTDISLSLAGGVAIGDSAHANKTNAIAIGTDSNTNAIGNISIGRSTNTTGDLAIAIGDDADANGDGSIAFGSGSVRATAVNAVAIGQGASASGDNSMALGNGATVPGNNAVALGNGAIVLPDIAKLFPTYLDTFGTIGVSAEGWRMATTTDLTVSGDNASPVIALSSSIRTIWVQNRCAISLTNTASLTGTQSLALRALMETITSGDTLTLTIPQDRSADLDSDAVISITMDADPIYESNSFASVSEFDFDEYWRLQVTIAAADVEAVTILGTDEIEIDTRNTFNQVVEFKFEFADTGFNDDNKIVLGNSDITELNCNVQSISALSDKRDKTDIADLSDADGLPFINDLQPRTFHWDRREWYDNRKPDGSKKNTKYDASKPNSGKHMGFIAQEVEEAIGDIQCIGDSNLVTGNAYKKQMAYAELITPMVKAIQQLSSENDALKARLDALENP